MAAGGSWPTDASPAGLLGQAGRWRGDLDRAAFWSGLTPGAERAGRKTALRSGQGFAPQSSRPCSGREPGRPPFPPRLVAAGSVINARASAIPADLADFAVSNLPAGWEEERRRRACPARPPRQRRAGQQAAKTQAAKPRAANVPPAVGLKINDVLPLSLPLRARSRMRLQTLPRVRSRAQGASKVAAMCRGHPTMAPLLAGLAKRLSRSSSARSGHRAQPGVHPHGPAVVHCCPASGSWPKVAGGLASMALLAPRDPRPPAQGEAGTQRKGGLLKSRTGRSNIRTRFCAWSKVGGKVLILALDGRHRLGHRRSKQARAGRGFHEPRCPGPCKDRRGRRGPQPWTHLSPGVQGRHRVVVRAERAGKLTGQPAPINQRRPRATSSPCNGRTKEP